MIAIINLYEAILRQPRKLFFFFFFTIVYFWKQQLTIETMMIPVVEKSTF